MKADLPRRHKKFDLTWFDARGHGVQHNGSRVRRSKMDYSYRIPLWGRTLKIKSESRLRARERSGEVPTFRLLSTYFVWEPKASGSGQTRQSKNGEPSDSTPGR